MVDETFCFRAGEDEVLRVIILRGRPISWEFGIPFDTNRVNLVRCTFDYVNVVCDLFTLNDNLILTWPVMLVPHVFYGPGKMLASMTLACEEIAFSWFQLNRGTLLLRYLFALIA